ncbi:Mitochondrial carrier protein MTM1 [Morella rubra]|uniref:Mitochondrial carrier protein MTM1 n=1 Tax=Morella rubra TaxID=262757 RepID=A0A6A1W2S2_9ROSI|nr:Mitochondrial carrier protein MTM1 [Morella rubra]
MVGSKQGLPSWISAAAVTRVDFQGNSSISMPESMLKETSSSSASPSSFSKKVLSDVNLGFGERALSAAGAAVLSAVLVNPLDVAKTRLQAQAAGVTYQGMCRMACFDTNTMLPDRRCSTSSARAVFGSEPECSPDCRRYKGTLDVFYKVIRQEGFATLWRGTTASLALAVPTVGIYLPCYDVLRNVMEDFTAQRAPNLTPYVPLVAGSIARSLACVSCYPVELARTRMQAFKETQTGVKPAGVWKTLIGVIDPVKSTNVLQNLQSYRVLWTGLGAQLARDIPFSAICWSTLEQIRRRILGVLGDEASAASVFGANFCAGFIAGSLAASATCPLDVAKTRQQIEEDPARALKMTTRKTLREIWRDGGMKGLFTGIGPRVGRAGPSVGIVVSFYELVKYALHHRRLNQ